MQAVDTAGRELFPGCKTVAQMQNVPSLAGRLETFCRFTFLSWRGGYPIIAAQPTPKRVTMTHHPKTAKYPELRLTPATVARPMLKTTIDQMLPRRESLPACTAPCWFPAGS